jgi:tungstate transport system substrate-binding protein
MKHIYTPIALLLILPFLFLDAHAQERLRMATTTSVQDSGLLPYLLVEFEKKCGCKVDVIAVGTGQALKLAPTETWTWFWSTTRSPKKIF